MPEKCTTAAARPDASERGTAATSATTAAMRTVPAATWLPTIGLSVRPVSRSRAHERATVGARAAPATYPLMVAAHMGLLTLPLLEIAGRRQRPPRWGWIAVLAGATALRLWSIRSLGGAWNIHAVVPRDV